METAQVHPHHATPRYRKPGVRVDGRTRAGRRVAELVAAIVEALGGPDAVDGLVKVQAIRVAELTAAAEAMRGAVLKRRGSTGADLERLIKLESELRRAWRELGQPLASLRPPEPSPGLAILEQRVAEREAREARKAQAKEPSDGQAEA
jgi:hypothetical protein